MRPYRTLLARIRHRIRVKLLNMSPGIRIAVSTYIARSAIIQANSDGSALGGSIVVAEGVAISDGVIVAPYGGTIEIEANSYIGPYCVLYGHGGLKIGRRTMIGAHTVIIPANHGFEQTDVPMKAQPLTRKGIHIADDVWVGSGCKVLDGVRIGRGAVIGAGSVVTRDIDAYSIAFGVPAAVVGRRRADAEDHPPA